MDPSYTDVCFMYTSSHWLLPPCMLRGGATGGGGGGAGPALAGPILILSLKIHGTVHEKIAPLIYYKNVIKMHHVCIAITSQRLTLSTSYFHHFILHHFSTVKCILESWTISVPTFLRAIPPGVQNYHIFV